MARPSFSGKTIDDVAEVLRSGFIREGPKVKEFEDGFREKVGSRHAYAVSSGTAALHTAYLSILKPQDEVIVPAFTFFATASTVVHSGGMPVFSDIDPETFLIEPEDVKMKITARTRAIAPVHLFGNAADMDSLADLAEDHGLFIVSDSAQAHGTEYRGRDVGSFDTLNCFSFYPTKSMTTGEGGMVTTNEEGLDGLGRLIRNHGDDSRYHHVILGLNYRMTEICAAIGLNQLSDLDGCLARRRHCGKALSDGIGEIDGLTPQKVGDGVNHSYSYFSVVMDPEEFRCTRGRFLEALRAENIDSAVHYPAPLTKQPAITILMKPQECPVSEEIADRVFSLPMHPGLSDEDLSNILAGVEKVAGFFLK